MVRVPVADASGAVYGPVLVSPEPESPESPQAARIAARVAV
jgi:hypothetical protein